MRTKKSALFSKSRISYAHIIHLKETFQLSCDTVHTRVTMSSKYKCIGVPMTELPRPSTTDKYSGIGSSLSGMILFQNKSIRISIH